MPENLLLASDLMGYDDKELGRYLISVNNLITVQDPKNFTGEFLQRLRDFRNPEKRPAAAPQLDLDYVNAKLSEPFIRPHRRRVPSPEIDHIYDDEYDMLHHIQLEEMAYDLLVGMGGRPLFHEDMIEDVMRNTAAYKHLLLPINIYMHPQIKDDIAGVAFSFQYMRWERFLDHQHEVRSTPEALAAFNESSAKRRAALGLGQHKPIVFAADPKQQNKLTTWAEYLESEFKSYARFQHPNGFDVDQFLKERHLQPARYINWVIEQFPLIEQEMVASLADESMQSTPIQQSRKIQQGPVSAVSPLSRRGSQHQRRASIRDSRSASLDGSGDIAHTVSPRHMPSPISSPVSSPVSNKRRVSPSVSVAEPSLASAAKTARGADVPDHTAASARRHSLRNSALQAKGVKEAEEVEQVKEAKAPAAKTDTASNSSASTKKTKTTALKATKATKAATPKPATKKAKEAKTAKKAKAKTTKTTQQQISTSSQTGNKRKRA